MPRTLWFPVLGMSVSMSGFLGLGADTRVSHSEDCTRLRNILLSKRGDSVRATGHGCGRRLGGIGGGPFENRKEEAGRLEGREAGQAKIGQQP
mmetsp:Transcript_121261/g.338466  ORF Transcript_121261/g.338466 Transcript_121261/m.338466 type:complete len:93 (+) Transcript_121261:395-673(+)